MPPRIPAPIPGPIPALVPPALILAATLFSADLSHLRAHAQTPSAEPAPTIQVYSRETIIDVLVTDDKGQPVRGLTQSDFTIEEDNKPQAIRSFSEYDKTTPPPPPRTLPPNTFTNNQTLSANGPVQIFLFDLLGASPADMERAKKYIASYFPTMPAGTHVAVFEFSPSKGLDMLQGITNDGHAAAAAVENLDVEWIRNGVAAYPIAIAGMNQIAAYVASIHGRKNLIWIVQGMPLAITHDGGQGWPKLADGATRQHLMDLYDCFTREQIAVYPLDPRGVHDFGKNAMEQMNALLTQAVAAETGGAVPNSNDYQGTISTLINDTLHGYTLSFVPPRPTEDGHYHAIKITVSRPNLHLSYRPGYKDEQPHPLDAVLKQQMIQGPMRLGAIPSTQILFNLQVEPAQPASDVSSQPAISPIPATAAPHTKGAPYYTLFLFDPRQIALTQNPDGTRTANLEIDLGAFDSFGQLVAARSRTFKLTITPAQYPGFLRGQLKFTLPIDLPHGQLTLRAGLFDTVSGKAGTLEIPLTIPKR
jgi:VWFA-related protein